MKKIQTNIMWKKETFSADIGGMDIPQLTGQMSLFQFPTQRFKKWINKPISGFGFTEFRIQKAFLISGKIFNFLFDYFRYFHG